VWATGRSVPGDIASSVGSSAKSAVGLRRGGAGRVGGCIVGSMTRGAVIGRYVWSGVCLVAF